MEERRDIAVVNGRARSKPRSAERYLKVLGERVRNTRACHGMTRSTLARDSGVSERYLAQLEIGQGNFSILLLRKVALAIDIPLSELVNDGPQPTVEYALLLEKLRRLKPAELAAAASVLSNRFTDGGGRYQRIALIGVRGAGKTTLGRMLAQRLRMPFVELTKEIEAEVGASVSEIFELLGQAAYRRYERRVLERILKTKPRAVIATGGGLVSQPSTFERLLDCCYTVWLQAPPKEVMSRKAKQGDYRARAGLAEAEAMADLRRIVKQRKALYGKADTALDTTGKSIESTVDELVDIVTNAWRMTSPRVSASGTPN
jgi:XRE family transcriptional regulator, aerobic/anaerobic benzoate catabolism transcriptional regulator